MLGLSAARAFPEPWALAVSFAHDARRYVLLYGSPLSSSKLPCLSMQFEATVDLKIIEASGWKGRYPSRAERCPRHCAAPYLYLHLRSTSALAPYRTSDPLRRYALPPVHPGFANGQGFRPSSDPAYIRSSLLS
jgi:hypothetical protein